MWHVANALVKCCSVEQPKEVKEKKEELLNQEIWQHTTQ
jgi:hypothetical protein